jgi:hypothetical protein
MKTLKSTSFFFVLLSCFFMMLAGCSSLNFGSNGSVSTQPSITNFTAASSTITSGASTTLTAVFANGTGVITGGASSIPVTSGTAVTVSPTATTTYTLTVTPTTGTAITQTVTVTVTPAVIGPTITSFTAGSASITSGASTTLTAVFTGGTGVITPGNVTASSGTAVTVSPTATTIYTLTVTPTTGTAVTQTVTVTVTPVAPTPTVTLSASPISITSGGSSTLTWSSTNATSCTATGGWTGTEATSGTKSVSPTTTTIYTLTCTGSGGTSSPASATVTVGGTAPDVTITVNPSQTHPISPWIYGINGSGIPNAPDVTINRMGGDRWTAYNWTTNASNAGSDYLYESDNYLTSSTVPGFAVYPTINADIAAGQATLITEPMQGLVSADESGPVTLTNAPVLARFQVIVNKKSTVSSAAFTTTPPVVVVNGEDTGAVYSDEFAWALNQLSTTKDIFTSTTATPTFVDLDNEPDLWKTTHQEVQGSTEITPAAFITKTVTMAKALKDQFPDMVILGPVNYGFEGIYTWQGGTTGTTATGANWFADLYLQGLSTASAVYGKPLVDSYDFHWYPEEYDGNTRILDMTSATLSDADMQLIVQAPRNLWDTTYNDSNNSNPWIYNSLGSTPVNILGRLQAKIGSEFPSMSLSVSEYETGGFNNIAGTVAQADQLGVYANQGVFAAMLWPPNGTFDYELAGFRAYRNFDGAGSNFGDVSLQATSSNPGNVMAYVSTDSKTPGRVVIEVINRANTTQVAAITGLSLSGTASLYQMTAATASTQSTAGNPVKPVSIGTKAVSGSTLTLTLPAYSVTTINVP